MCTCVFMHVMQCNECHVTERNVMLVTLCYVTLRCVGWRWVSCVMPCYVVLRYFPLCSVCVGDFFPVFLAGLGVVRGTPLW